MAIKSPYFSRSSRPRMAGRTMSKFLHPRCRIVRTPNLSAPLSIMAIDIWTNIQKEPWFIEINPNDRIPALTDRARGGFHVFETAAIMHYLAQHYDKEKRFTFDIEKEANYYGEMLQWVSFAVRCDALSGSAGRAYY
jgi:glutathione S-transferase